MSGEPAPQSKTKKTQIYIVDDHPLVRGKSLSSLINQQPDLAVCGESESAVRAMREIIAIEPDVAILDISLKESSGLELIKAVKAKMPRLSIVVLSMHDEQLYAERCIRAGASAYVMKRESSKRIVVAVREVMAGRMCVSDQIAGIFAQKYPLADGRCGVDRRSTRSATANWRFSACSARVWRPARWLLT